MCAIAKQSTVFQNQALSYLNNAREQRELMQTKLKAIEDHRKQVNEEVTLTEQMQQSILRRMTKEGEALVSS